MTLRRPIPPPSRSARQPDSRDKQEILRRLKAEARARFEAFRVFNYDAVLAHDQEVHRLVNLLYPEPRTPQEGP